MKIVDQPEYLDFVMRACFGLATTFYILIMFGQNYITSTIAFAPMISNFYYKTSQEIGGEMYLS